MLKIDINTDNVHNVSSEKNYTRLVAFYIFVDTHTYIHTHIYMHTHTIVKFVNLGTVFPRSLFLFGSGLQSSQTPKKFSVKYTATDTDLPGRLPPALSPLVAHPSRRC